MIHHLRGTLIHKSLVAAVLETAGVGWEVRIPVSTAEKLPAVGAECSLYTYLSISQDDMRIYGFYTIAERELYSLLIKVNGIGPKIAISILSTLSISAFVRSIQTEEEGLLTKVPGIGKKTAQRIVIELKDKIHHLADFVEQGYDAGKESHIFEVEDALVALGFSLANIQRELKLMSEEELNQPSEQLTKELIKRLYQRAK